MLQHVWRTIVAIHFMLIRWKQVRRHECAKRAEAWKKHVGEKSVAATMRTFASFTDGRG